MRVVLHSEKLRGEVERGIFLRTNDPARPNLQLIVHALVRTSIEVWPFDQMHLGNGSSGAQRASVLVRRDTSDPVAELRIDGLRASPSWLHARAERLEQARHGSNGLPMGRAGDWIIEAEIIGQPDYGKTEAEIRFRTGLTHEPEFRLPVIVDLAPPVRLNEERVLIPWPGGAEGATTSFLAALRPGVDPASLKVESTSPSLAVQLEPLGPRHLRIRTRWTDSQPPAAEIVFRVDQESYRVPVSAAAP